MAECFAFAPVGLNTHMQLGDQARLTALVLHAPQLVTMNRCRTAQRVKAAQRPPGLGLDAAAGYTCTLSLVGNPRADLPSGARAKKQAVGTLHVSYR